MAGNIPRQLEELQLIECSLLPDERFCFTLESEDHCATWRALQKLYADNPQAACEHIPTELPPPCFQIKIGASADWLDVALPTSYPAALDAVRVVVRGDAMSRDEQARWQRVVAETMAGLEGSEYPIFELITQHLLPRLHAEVSSHVPPAAPHKPISAESQPVPHAHALLTSHHLRAPSKRRALQQWSAALGVAGFAKVGYPGVIYVEGARPAVDTFVTRVKNLQWLALRVRFVESVEPAPVGLGAVWVEYEKVGEVVAAMRRLGREEWVLGLGIGSAGASQ